MTEKNELQGTLIVNVPGTRLTNLVVEAPSKIIVRAPNVTISHCEFYGVGLEYRRGELVGVS